MFQSPTSTGTPRELIGHSRLEIKETFLSIIKADYGKLIANIKLNEEELKAISLNSGIRLSILSIPITYSALSLTYSNKTTERDQGNTTWKGKSKSVFI